MPNRWGKWGGGTAVDWQPEIALASITRRMIIMISDEQMNDTELRRWWTGNPKLTPSAQPQG